MVAYRFRRYVADQVFRTAVEYQILFGDHLLGPILDIWPHQAVSQMNVKKILSMIQYLSSFVASMIRIINN